MTCRDIQERLAGGDERQPRDAAVREHLDGCPDCRAVAARLAAVGDGLAELPELPPSEQLVRRTLERVSAAAPAGRGALRLALAIGSVAGLVLVAFLSIDVLVLRSPGGPPVVSESTSSESTSSESTDPESTDWESTVQANRNERTPPAGSSPETANESISSSPRTTLARQMDDGQRSANGLSDDRERDGRYRLSRGRRGLGDPKDGWWQDAVTGRDGRGEGEADSPQRPSARSDVRGDVGGEKRRQGRLGWYEVATGGRPTVPPSGKDGHGDDPSKTQGLLAGAESGGRAQGERTRDEVDRSRETVDTSALSDRSVDRGFRRSGSETTELTAHEHTVDRVEGVDLARRDAGIDLARGSAGVDPASGDDGVDKAGGEDLPEGDFQTLALAQVARRLEPDEPAGGTFALDLPTFLPARGYFANTYVPGDPTLAWLRRSLADVLQVDGQPVRPEEKARPYAQPFDPPERDALAVYLGADRAAVAGPTRLTVQVGLAGSERHARRRAPLNAALVVDLRTVPGEAERRALWSLADELADRREAGDRFALVVAGVPRPLRLDAADFERAAVTSALAAALDERIAADGAAPLTDSPLVDAFTAAWAFVRAGGSDAAPLGVDLVLFAGAGPLGAEADALVPAAHAASVAGVSLGAFGVGAGADAEGLARLALAGQGRRRLVAVAADARTALDEELLAVGRVVARAVRLRIRLAEGVHLVEVLGSQPLDNVETGRVRAAERAVDRRLARTLGIEADRGADEDGIQVVIPAFYAGDAHIVLLDVVADGPGPIADVQVRYKDLVRLDNAVAQARLALPAASLSAMGGADGPLVRNVKKNRLAYELAVELRAAAAALRDGDGAGALAAVERALERQSALQAREPALSADEELARDAALLAEYRRLLQERAAWQADDAIRDHVARSLEYAGRVKSSPRR